MSDKSLLALQPRSPYELMAGTVIAAALVTGINSDLPGQTIRRSHENVYDTVTGKFAGRDPKSRRSR